MSMLNLSPFEGRRGRKTGVPFPENLTVDKYGQISPGEYKRAMGKTRQEYELKKQKLQTQESSFDQENEGFLMQLNSTSSPETLPDVTLSPTIVSKEISVQTPKRKYKRSQSSRRSSASTNVFFPTPSTESPKVVEVSSPVPWSKIQFDEVSCTRTRTRTKLRQVEDFEVPELNMTELLSPIVSKCRQYAQNMKNNSYASFECEVQQIYCEPKEEIEFPILEPMEIENNEMNEINEIDEISEQVEKVEIKEKVEKKKPQKTERKKRNPAKSVLTPKKTPKKNQIEVQRKSTRMRIKPLEFWRNEKVTYRNIRLPNGALALEAREIITYDEEEEQVVKKKRKLQTGPTTIHMYDTEKGTTLPMDAIFRKNQLDLVETEGYKYQTLVQSEGTANVTLMELPAKAIKEKRLTGGNHFIFIVDQGTLTFTIHNQTFPLSKGEVMIVPPDNEYEFRNQTNSKARVYVTVIK